MQACKTLGERTYFLYNYTPDRLCLLYGFKNINQKFVILNDEFIHKVIERVNYIKSNKKIKLTSTSQYEIQHWDECPHTIYAPYVAKLVIDVFHKDLINQIMIKFKNENINYDYPNDTSI